MKCSRSRYAGIVFTDEWEARVASGLKDALQEGTRRKGLNKWEHIKTHAILSPCSKLVLAGDFKRRQALLMLLDTIGDITDVIPLSIGAYFQFFMPAC